MMRIIRSFSLFFLNCVAALLFTGGTRISPHHLSQSNWYLDHQADSSEFFSADTLRFLTPYPMWKIVVGDLGDTLSDFPEILFNNFRKEASFFLFLKNKRPNWNLSQKEFRGLYSASNRTKTIIMNYYEPGNISSDYIRNWDKKATMKYNVLRFSRSELVLVKIKTE